MLIWWKAYITPPKPAGSIAIEPPTLDLLTWCETDQSLTLGSERKQTCIAKYKQKRKHHLIPWLLEGLGVKLGMRGVCSVCLGPWLAGGAVACLWFVSNLMFFKEFWWCQSGLQSVWRLHAGRSYLLLRTWSSWKRNLWKQNQTSGCYLCGE